MWVYKERDSTVNVKIEALTNATMKMGSKIEKSGVFNKKEVVGIDIMESYE